MKLKRFTQANLLLVIGVLHLVPITSNAGARNLTRCQLKVAQAVAAAIYQKYPGYTGAFSNVYKFIETEKFETAVVYSSIRDANLDITFRVKRSNDDCEILSPPTLNYEN